MRPHSPTLQPHSSAPWPRILLVLAAAGIVGASVCPAAGSLALSESFTEDSLAALREEGFEPAEESRATEIAPEAALADDPGFPSVAGARGGVLRLSSGSLILPFSFPNTSFWLAFQMQRESAKGFPLLILRGGLKHHLIKIGDMHDDRINGVSASLSGAEPAEPPLPVPVSDPNLIVAYYDAGSETLTLWLNPPLGPEAPAADSAYVKVGPADPARPGHQKPPFGSIELVSPPNTSALFDEIRIAESWPDLGLAAGGKD